MFEREVKCENSFCKGYEIRKIYEHTPALISETRVLFWLPFIKAERPEVIHK